MLLESKQSLSYPFDLPGLCGKNFEFGESGVRYIENVIMCDKIYRLILQAHNRWDSIVSTNDPELIGKEKHGLKYISLEEERYMASIEQNNLHHFLTKFLDDPKCPITVKGYIYYYVGNDIGHMKINIERGGDKYKKDYKNYVQRSFLTERWMKICR